MAKTPSLAFMFAFFAFDWLSLVASSSIYIFIYSRYLEKMTLAYLFLSCEVSFYFEAQLTPRFFNRKIEGSKYSIEEYISVDSRFLFLIIFGVKYQFYCLLYLIHQLEPPLMLELRDRMVLNIKIHGRSTWFLANTQCLDAVQLCWENSMRIEQAIQFASKY